jgi:hypothetical protein
MMKELCGRAPMLTTRLICLHRGAALHECGTGIGEVQVDGLINAQYIQNRVQGRPSPSLG